MRTGHTQFPRARALQVKLVDQKLRMIRLGPRRRTKDRATTAGSSKRNALLDDPNAVNRLAAEGLLRRTSRRHGSEAWLVVVVCCWLGGVEATAQLPAMTSDVDVVNYW